MRINRFRGIERQQRIDEGALRRRELLDPHRPASIGLLEAWAPVENELRLAVERSTFNIWLAPLHPHSLVAGVWKLAYRPENVSWIVDRFGRLIAEVAQRPVEFVVCSALTTSTEGEKS